MSTKEQALEATLGITQRLEPLLLQLSTIGKSFAEISTTVNATHEQSQLLGALIDALQPQVVDKIVEVLPPNFLDVKAFANAKGEIVGAKADGKTDDTAVIQLAIDTAARLNMVCWFGKGRYLVDPRVQLLPRTGSWLQFHPEAWLVAMPNDAQRTNVLYLEDITDVWLLDVQIEGDRMQHDYTNPGTEEWGHGIKITNSCARIAIRGGNIKRCHGDGLSISAEDVYMFRVTSTQNRRQGLTIGSARHMRVVECEFSETRALTVDGVTNAHTAPGAGIDMEPDKNDARDILILNCKIFNNATCGILMWMRSEVGKTITEVILRGNTVYGNPNQVQSKALAGFVQFEAYGNNLTYTTGSGFRIEAGSRVVLGSDIENSPDRNTIQKSTGTRTDFNLKGTNTQTVADIRIIAPTGALVPADVLVKWNAFR